jgi:translation initiation factor 1
MDKPDARYAWVHRESPPSPSSRPPGAARRPQVRLERKGRKGKTVTVLEHLAVSDDRLREILRTLQQACGTGGTCKDHHIELQGDFQVQVRQWLAKHGT